MKTCLCVLLSCCCLFTACDFRWRSREDNPREDRVLEKTIRTNVQQAAVHIGVKAGKLLVTGGANDLMEAHIAYSRAAWEPVVDFNEDGQMAQLSIEQKEITADLDLNTQDDRNLWVIRLSDNIKQDISCEIGAGETEMNLEGMSLSKVRVDAGVGEHQIILRNTSVPEVVVNAGVGKVTLDLGGTWHNSLMADIKGGIGELILKVPANVGIRLQVKSGLGEVKAPGLKKDGRTYTNDLYGTDAHQLTFDVRAGLGAIMLIIEE